MIAIQEPRVTTVAAPVGGMDFGKGDGRLRRRSRNWALAAAVLCPCHLPMVIAVLGAVGFAGASSWLGANVMIVAGLSAPLAGLSLWLAVTSGDVVPGGAG